MVIIKEQIDTRLPNNDMSGIKMIDVKWSAKTAGPSPFDNERTEIFFLGCNKAITGNPCKGCFNIKTWNSDKAEWSHDPILMAQHINNNAPNKYVTIGGGETTDQIENLIILCKELKKYGFHIMLYTWRNLKYETSLFWHKSFPYEYRISISKWITLLKYVDIIVDGEYKEEERLWDGSKEDGLLSSVGSGNQIIWDIKNKHGFAMRDIDYLWINPDNNDLLFILKDLDCETHSLYI